MPGTRPSATTRICPCLRAAKTQLAGVEKAQEELAHQNVLNSQSYTLRKRPAMFAIYSSIAGARLPRVQPEQLAGRPDLGRKGRAVFVRGQTGSAVR